MKVKILEFDKPNLNNRIYPREVMEKAIKKYEEEYIKNNRAFIFSNIPTEIDNDDLRHIIGRVNSIKTENDKVVVEIEKLNVNNADEFWPLIEQGKMSVRTSGIGTITKQSDGTWIIGSDYQLTTMFLTTEPA